ncbi:MAG: SIMPL domain-containing protein [Gemmatimonadetes bacterium]|nr:SIMPL domain-containing protein [Gemmatimonadota bacterium]
MRTIFAFATSLLAIPAAATAQQPPAAAPPPIRTITVSGTGTVLRQPDQAVVNLAVESFAATAEQAARENADKMDAMLKAIRQAGIPQEKIRTVSYQLTPEYDYSEPRTPRQPGEQRLVGYRAMNMVMVTIDDIRKVGPVIDAAIKAGGNRVAGINFQLKDPDAARQDALRQAVQKARREAATLVEASGETLGELVTLTTAPLVEPPVPMFRRAEALAVTAPAPTPVEPGQLEIQATVSATYRIGAR